MIQALQKISDFSKTYGFLGAEVTGAVGLTSKLVSVFFKDGAIKASTKNLASLGGYGFLAGASIFTGAYIAENIINKFKK